MYCVSLLYFIIVRLHKLKTLRLLAQRSYYFAVHTHKIPIFARSSDVHYLIITNFSLQKSLILALAKLCLQQLWLYFRSRLLPSSIPFSLASSNFIFRLPQVYARGAVLHTGRLDKGVHRIVLKLLAPLKFLQNVIFHETILWNSFGFRSWDFPPNLFLSLHFFAFLGTWMIILS